MNWWRGLKSRIKFSEPLRGRTTFKIGGPAKYFVEPKGIEDLKSLLNSANKYKIPILVIGAGSNILVSDKGVNAAVLYLNSPYFKKISFKNNRVEVGAGCPLSKFINFASKRGLSGAEWLAGMPGTIGGALAMNAGQGRRGLGLGDLVESVTVIDYNGRVKNLRKKSIRFGYRTSSLSKYIVLNAHLKLAKKNKKEIKGKINECVQYRKITQDLSRPSAGCIFKNPQGAQAGRLIDLCGLKGLRIGDAFVSMKHANFILNEHRAKAKDVLQLISLVKKKVKNKFNINLEPEIKIWQ